MRLDIAGAARLLRENDDILVLCHSHPDGDTLGSGFGLMHILKTLGKRSRLECADVIVEKYLFMGEGLPEESFEPQFTVAVDVADIELLSKSMAEKYRGKIDLCIDHHGSNTGYADNLLLDSSAAATAEIFCPLADELGVEIDKKIAGCLYTGIATDTGCFRFSNTTARTHMLAARLMEAGAEFSRINRVFFETKTRTYAELERMALESMRMYFGGKCAVITITQDMFIKSGSNDGETDGISGLSRQVEGVLAGVTLKETDDGAFKVSVRSHEPINASEICKRLGGGGHTRAAGCKLSGTLDEAVNKVLAVVKSALNEAGVSTED